MESLVIFLWEQTSCQPLQHSKCCEITFQTAMPCIFTWPHGSPWEAILYKLRSKAQRPWKLFDFTTVFRQALPSGSQSILSQSDENDIAPRICDLCDAWLDSHLAKSKSSLYIYLHSHIFWKNCETQLTSFLWVNVHVPLVPKMRRSFP